jgi:hypothetical protein
VTDADQRPVLKESYQTQIRFGRKIGSKWPKSIFDRPKRSKNLNVFAQITSFPSSHLQIRVVNITDVACAFFATRGALNNPEPALNFAQSVIER